MLEDNANGLEKGYQELQTRLMRLLQMRWSD